MLLRKFVLACALVCSALPALAQAPYSRFGESMEPGPETDFDPAQRAWRSWSERSALALAASGAPRDLAFAAALRRLSTVAPVDVHEEAPSRIVETDSQAAAWRRDAAARAGNDVLANTLLVYDSDEATRLRAGQRWLGADPQNLAPLLMRGGNADVLLSDARTASRFDLGMLEQVRWMQAALLRTLPTASERAALADAGEFVAEEHAAIQAMGLWAAVAIPGLQPLMEGCNVDALRASPSRAQDCRHVARLMAEHSDTQLGTMIGLALSERTAQNAAERAEVQAGRRTLDWRNLEWGRASMDLPRDGAPQLVRLLADPSIRTEADLVSRALQEAGVPLEPPTGWQPPR